MSRLLRQLKWWRMKDNAECNVLLAARTLNDLLHSADLVYATQDEVWQESEAGIRHVETSHQLRHAMVTLHTFVVPDLKGLG